MPAATPRGGGAGISDGVPDDLQARIEHARTWLPLGSDLAGNLPPRVRRAVALARECGASVGPVLAAAGDSARDRVAVGAELERVVGPAVSVARGLVLMPVVVVPVLAVVLDIDLMAFWLGSGPGRLVGALVVAMVAVAAAWLWLLVRTATAPGPVPRPRRLPAGVTAAGGVVAAVLATPLVGWWVVPIGLGTVAMARRRPAPTRHPDLDEAAELTAVAVAAGVDLPGALRLAAMHLVDPRLSADVAALALRLSLVPPGRAMAPSAGHARRDRADRAGAARPEIAPLADLVTDLVAAGRPAAAPLRRLAARLRRAEADRVRVEVARLPGRLTFPTTVLLVPATVLAIGAPIAMRGLQALAGT